MAFVSLVIGLARFACAAAPLVLPRGIVLLTRHVDLLRLFFFRNTPNNDSTIRGAPDTDFAGGIYHGRILLPPEYPFKPPHVVFLTPSGRFETHTKICLSFSAFHPELWQPAWGKK